MKNTMLAAVLICTLVLCGSASSELTGVDIGVTWPPNPPGSLTIDTPGSDYTVDAAGRDIWGNADSFHYAYEPVLVTGDFEAIVQVESITWLHAPLNVNNWAKAGIMARANVTEDSANAMVCRTGHNGIHLQARQVDGRHSITENLGSGDVFGSHIWIKLARKGNVFAAWYAQDILGSPGPWQDPNIVAVVMPASVFLGLATTSKDNTPIDNVMTAIYKNYSVGPLTDFPPLPVFGPFPGPQGGGGYMGIREVIDNGNINNQDDCNDSLTSGTGTIVDYNAPVLNITDSGPAGHFGGDDVFDVVTAGHQTYGNVNHISLVAKGAIEIPTDGHYTFCLTTDDGFTLQFHGYDFTGIAGGGEIVPYANGSALQFWSGRPLADTFGTIYLPAGHRPFVLTYHEGHSDSALEFSAAPGGRVYFDKDFLLVGSSEMVPVKPPVPNPPLINGGAGWPVTMVYEPDTAGPSQSDDLDSAIANVEAAWAGRLPGPNNVVTATANWLNFEDPDRGGGGKGFPQQPFPGSNDGLNNDHFAMGAGATLPLDVAVFGGPLYPALNTDVQSKLLATGQFNSVSIINVQTTTPTLAELQAFDAVLVYSSDAPYANPIPLGNVMADYVDSGGGVVCMMFEIGAGGGPPSPFMMQGRWDADRYYVIERTSLTQGSQAALGNVYQPAHPIMQGVSSFKGGGSSYRPTANNLTTGSIRVADWSDGRALIAVKNVSGTARVDLGFHPPSSDARADFWDSTTDGDLLMANALSYVGGAITSTIMTVPPEGYELTDQFDYWEDQTSHSYVATGQCSQGTYTCSGDMSIRIGNCNVGTGSTQIVVSVTPGTDKIKLRYKVPWAAAPGCTLYADGVNQGAILSNSCNWQEKIITDMSAYTADGLVEITITDEASGCGGDIQITYLEVYSLKEVLCTFLMYGDDSSQFRILDLAGGDPLDWDINDYEMPVGKEIIRLADGTGFRFHGWNVDAKGTIRLLPDDYDVQVMFNERGDFAYFGLWASLNGSRIFLLGDTTPVPGAPEIHALNLVCPYMLLGDVNHDCRNDFLDLAFIGMNWLIDCAMDPSDPACIHK